MNGLLPAADGTAGAADAEAAAGADRAAGAAGASKLDGIVSEAGAWAMVAGCVGVEDEAAGALTGTAGWFTVGAASWAQESTSDKRTQRRQE